MNSGSESFLDRLIERQWSFIGVFFVVFLATYLLLVAIDFVPEPVAKAIDSDTTEVEMDTNTKIRQSAGIAVVDTAELLPEYPVEIYIEKLDKSIPVLNPRSREVADLDNALLSGAVRHPDSAMLGQAGNVFILGHSSYLPSVFNSNFKAFNGIQDLEWGDEIQIYSDDAVFTYRVDKVYRAEAEEVIVPIAGEENKLTLATCDSFGAVNERFIVEATEIDRKSL